MLKSILRNLVISFITGKALGFVRPLVNRIVLAIARRR